MRRFSAPRRENDVPRRLGVGRLRRRHGDRERPGHGHRRREGDDGRRGSRLRSERDCPGACAAARVGEIDLLCLGGASGRRGRTRARPGAAKTSGLSARGRLMTPPPARTVVSSETLRSSVQAVSPVSASADFTCAGVHVGWRWRSSATPPATCGAAMLVPESVAYESPGAAEKIETPGALTSGFRRSESGVGPLEENEATTSSGPLRDRRDGADRDRVRRRAGRADRPAAEVAEVVAGRDDGDHAGAGRCGECLHDDVARRLDLGLAERHVDHVHAVGDGRLDRSRELRRVAVEAHVGVGGDRQRLVVAEVRARRDAGDACSLGERVVVSGGDARDVGAVRRQLAGRTASTRSSRSGGRAGTRARR